MISFGQASSEITESHITAFLQFVSPSSRELKEMLKDVLLNAPYGSRARETAQLFQRFLEDSKSRNELVLVNGVPIERYLAKQKIG